MVSVIIPARNEQFLQPTIDSVLENATGEVEVIAVLDGYWPDPLLKNDPRVIVLHGERQGMRACINDGVRIAKGEFVFKLDAHCMLSPGWDEALSSHCEKDWVAVPSRKRLDAENWALGDIDKPDIDYMYLSYPNDPNDFGGPGLNGKVWAEKNRDESLKSIKIDDLMSSQGSAWFMRKDYFNFLELMDEENYGEFWNEMQEIGLKCWLSGGRMIVNKHCWYAHLHKGKKYGRGYHLPEAWLTKGATFTKNWMELGKAWHKQTLPIEWLIDKFSPVPTWPEVRRSALDQRRDSIATATIREFTPPTILKGFKRNKLIRKYMELGFTKGAEVGVAGGKFSEQILKSMPDLELYCIDPWIKYKGNLRGGLQSQHDRNYELAQQRLSPYNTHLIQKFSMDAVKDFKDGSLDFVYIDGHHDFDYVMEDIIEWSKKVRSGGIVSGHDYYHFPAHKAGVVEAVNAYVLAHEIKEWFVGQETEPSWFWVKP